LETPNRGTDSTDKRVAKRWDAETERLIEWFLNTPPPTEPFQIYSGVWIAGPARYWDSLRGDIAAGPKVGRDCFGAVRGDLRRLAELFDGPV